MLSLSRIAAVAAKEFVHLRRDRLTGGLIAGIPLLLTLLFGYAIDQDVRHLRASVLDASETSLSRAFVADAAATQVVDVVAVAHSLAELDAQLRRGDVALGLHVPADFAARATRGRRPFAQLLIDGSDPVVLASARALAAMPLPARAGAPGGTAAVPAIEIRPLYNPERRSAVFIVPGLVGVILTLTMVLFTAIAIVRERERGNLELLITTPLRSLELMLGKIVPYIVIGYVQVSLILLLGVFLFAVPIAGSLVDLYAGAGAFVAAALSLGLLISTLAASQFQAFQMTFVSFLPQLLLSGFMFPFDGMPRPARYFAEIFPLTHFLRIVRGIVLRGADLGELRGELWPLLAFCGVVLLLATLRFRKRLD
jgi:ABC-2 type transport system permease protein